MRARHSLCTVWETKGIIFTIIIMFIFKVISSLLLLLLLHIWRNVSKYHLIAWIFITLSYPIYVWVCVCLGYLPWIYRLILCNLNDLSKNGDDDSDQHINRKIKDANTNNGVPFKKPLHFYWSSFFGIQHTHVIYFLEQKEYLNKKKVVFNRITV